MAENWQTYYPYWDNAGGGSTSRTTSNVPAGSYRMQAVAGVASGVTITCSIVADGVTVATHTFVNSGSEAPQGAYVPFLLPKLATTVQMIVTKNGVYGSGGISIDQDLNYSTTKGHVNVDAAWRKITGEWVNVNGTWRKITDRYANINGVWKKQI